MHVDNFKRVALYDFQAQRWSDWTSGESVGCPTWSADSKYAYFDTEPSGSTSYRRVKIGEARSEMLFGLAELRRYAGVLGTWSGMAPDGEPLFVRDISTQEIYALNVQLP